MQNRTAIILPLSTVLQNVNIDRFIKFILDTAKKEDPDNLFQRELLEGLKLAHEFNLGMAPETFREKLLDIFRIKINATDFWREWNAMLTIGDIKSCLNLLKNYGNNVLFYFLCNTNIAHIEEINRACIKEKISMNVIANPMGIDIYPLYTTFQFKRNPESVIKLMTDEICNKKLNKPQRVVLIANDPERIVNKAQQQIAKNELANVKKHCDAHAVEMQYLKDNLEMTLDSLLGNPQQNVAKKVMK